MTNYPLSPAAPKGRNPSFAWWEEAFTDEEIEKIKEHGKALITASASISGEVGPAPENVRKTKVSWVGLTRETEWIYERMANVVKDLNAQFYNFDLYGFCEDLQFTMYEESESHYAWHIDMGDNSKSPRKMSLVLQLSDPSEYEGGELQVLTKPEPEPVTKKKGLVVAFPSYTLHRVTPVTKGARYTLVIWVCGPAFK